jgi:hypothetical protein
MRCRKKIVSTNQKRALSRFSQWDEVAVLLLHPIVAAGHALKRKIVSTNQKRALSRFSQWDEVAVLLLNPIVAAGHALKRKIVSTNQKSACQYLTNRMRSPFSSTFP